jgi:hypothetical protein
VLLLLLSCREEQRPRGLTILPKVLRPGSRRGLTKQQADPTLDQAVHLPHLCKSKCSLYTVALWCHGPALGLCTHGSVLTQALLRYPFLQEAPSPPCTLVTPGHYCFFVLFIISPTRW